LAWKAQDGRDHKLGLAEVQQGGVDGFKTLREHDRQGVEVEGVETGADHAVQRARGYVEAESFRGQQDPTGGSQQILGAHAFGQGPDPLIVIEKTYAYDASGRLETLSLSAPPTSPIDTTAWPETINYHHDLLSRVTAIDQSVAAGGIGAAITVERAYSSLGELTQERLILDGTAFETNATYDDNGTLEHLIYPDGTLYEVSERDPLSRMARLQVTSTAKAGPQPLWSAQYSGFRQTSGVQGALQLSRSFHDNGMPKDILGAIGDPELEYSGRYHLNRTYSDTLRFDTQFQATGVFTRDNLNHDLADRATAWDAARQNLPSLEALRVEEAPTDDASSETRRISFPQAGHDLLTSRTGISNGVPVSDYFQISTEDYRIQGSGPTSFSFDALGNRTAKLQVPFDPEVYTHDWANRLSTITQGDPGDEVTMLLRYDPSGRRVVQSESNGADTARIFWGQQVIAEYTKEAGGQYQLRKRNYWSENLDHLIAFDADNDLDGFLANDERFFTLTNPQGSITGIALEDGRLVESYAYRNDGTFTIYGEDLVPPELEYAAILPEDPVFGRDAQTLVLVFSEPVQKAHGIVGLFDDEDLQLTDRWSKMEDPRIWWTEIDPALVAGGQYTLMVDSVEDYSGNQQHHDPVVFVGVAETELLEIPLGPAKAAGNASPILAVIDGPDEVVVVLTRPIDPDNVRPQTLTVTDNGTPIPGTIEAFRPDAEDRPSRRPFKRADESDERAEVPPFAFVLKWSPDNPAEFQIDPSGAHEYEVILDLGTGKGLGTPEDPIGFYHLGLGTLVEEYEPDAPVLTASQVGNDRFLHGRPWMRSVGLYDHRARFYEPATMSFLEPDPLGPVDSPNLYQGFGFDGLNLVDPMGLATDYNLSPASPMRPKPMDIRPGVQRSSWLKDAAVGFEGMTAFDIYSAAAVHWFGDSPGLPRKLRPVGQGAPAGTYVNGIKNWPSKAWENAQDASDLLGIPLQPIWNPTVQTPFSPWWQKAWAFGFDGAQLFFVNKPNVLDATTKEVLAEVRAQLSTQDTTSLVGHSQGGAIVSSVAHHLTPEERARVDVVAIGGAAWGLPEGMRSVTMHVNNRDLVAMLTGGGMAPLRELLDRNENTRIIYYSFGELGNFETTHGVDVYLEAARTQGGSATVLEAEVIRDFLDGKGMDSWVFGPVIGVGR
jgi:RHS repeat-associated protein